MNMHRSIKKLYNDCGILIYNFPSHIDYTSIAERCVAQCKTHLPNIPIMSVGSPISGVDNHYQLDTPQHNKKVFGNKSKTWYNLARHLSLQISPWYRTVVIDSDYMIMTNQLLKLFASDQQILMHREWYDITNDSVETMSVGKSAIDMMWATVLKFDRTTEVEQFFDNWQKVIANYFYYAKLFSFSPHVIRNDFAVSIALKQLLNFGSVDHCVIPWSIHTTRDSVDVKHIQNSSITLTDAKGDFTVAFDCHVLHKESLADAC